MAGREVRFVCALPSFLQLARELSRKRKVPLEEAKIAIQYLTPEVIATGGTATVFQAPLVVAVVVA